MSLSGQEWMVMAVVVAAISYLIWRAAVLLKRRGGCGSCGSCGEKSAGVKSLVQLDSLPKQRQTP